MWKKQDDAEGAQPEFASKQMPEMTLESASETLIEAYRNRFAGGCCRSTIAANNHGDVLRSGERVYQER